MCVFQNIMSDRRIVTKRPDETFRCEKCARSFSELHYLTRHKREEHGPRVYCRHCNASFQQCRSFQLRDHEKRCQEKSYHPRGRILRESSEVPGGLGAGLLRQRGMTSSPDLQIFLAIPLRLPDPLQGTQKRESYLQKLPP